MLKSLTAKSGKQRKTKFGRIDSSHKNIYYNVNLNRQINHFCNQYEDDETFFSEIYFHLKLNANKRRTFLHI